MLRRKHGCKKLKSELWSGRIVQTFGGNGYEIVLIPTSRGRVPDRTSARWGTSPVTSLSRSRTGSHGPVLAGGVAGVRRRQTCLLDGAMKPVSGAWDCDTNRKRLALSSGKFIQAYRSKSVARRPGAAWHWSNLCWSCYARMPVLIVSSGASGLRFAHSRPPHRLSTARPLEEIPHRRHYRRAISVRTSAGASACPRTCGRLHRGVSARPARVLRGPMTQSRSRA